MGLDAFGATSLYKCGMSVTYSLLVEVRCFLSLMPHNLQAYRTNLMRPIRSQWKCAMREFTPGDLCKNKPGNSTIDP